MKTINAKIFVWLISICLLMAVGCATITSPTPAPTLQPGSSETIIKPASQLARDQYGENIIYYDFFSLPKNLNTRTVINLPVDLEAYLAAPFYNLTFDSKYAHDPRHFEKDILEAISECGYTVAELSKMDYRDAIFAIANVVADRINYGTLGKNFVKKYGRPSCVDDNFHQRIGDCVIYTETTIILFNYIKNRNPNLQNVYLTFGKLGGNLLDQTSHAWVAILIPQKNSLILSHIEPERYDSSDLDKKKFEADEFNICRALNDAVLKASVYRALGDSGDINTLSYAYNIFERSYRSATTDKTRGIILDNLAYTTYRMSFFTPPEEIYKQTKTRVRWIIGEYERNNYNPLHACALYYAYMISLRSGDANEANIYKQKLVNQFPYSKYAQRLQQP